MKNLKLIKMAFWLFMIGTVIQAQETISISGGNFTGNGGTVSCTVGQLFFKAYTNSYGTIFQGVQQPFEIFVMGIDENKGISLNCSAYPNPVTDFVILNVESYDLKKITYNLFDINGKLLQHSKVVNNETPISMENYMPSIYFLKVSDDHNKIKTFKIIKN